MRRRQSTRCGLRAFMLAWWADVDVVSSLPSTRGQWSCGRSFIQRDPAHAAGPSDVRNKPFRPVEDASLPMLERPPRFRRLLNDLLVVLVLRVSQSRSVSPNPYPPVWLDIVIVGAFQLLRNRHLQHLHFYGYQEKHPQTAVSRNQNLYSHGQSNETQTSSNHSRCSSTAMFAVCNAVCSTLTTPACQHSTGPGAYPHVSNKPRNSLRSVSSIALSVAGAADVASCTRTAISYRWHRPCQGLAIFVKGRHTPAVRIDCRRNGRG